jgi:hypothetical protein
VDKAFVAQGVANKLWATEAALDAAIADASKLMNEVLAAREELNVTHMVIDPAVTKVAESIATMTAARRALMEAHVSLAEAKLRCGIRTKLVGTAPSVDKDHKTFAEAVDTVVAEERRWG